MNGSIFYNVDLIIKKKRDRKSIAICQDTGDNYNSGCHYHPAIIFISLVMKDVNFMQHKQSLGA
ncbi:MAG: hypothetical protein JRJ46_09135 [Deltaproteobacteria bacterium]|nr:hypothetical protein [Deltaproteobacteria bacterium]